MRKVSFWCTLQITLTADLPLQLFFFEILSKQTLRQTLGWLKRSANTHTTQLPHGKTQYIDLSVKSAVLYQSKKSRFINTRLIKMDSWGLLLLSFQFSKTGWVPGPQPYWLVKCHAVLSQMVKKLCLLITLTADFPCNFALTFPLSAKKGIDKQASAWHYIF